MIPDKELIERRGYRKISAIDPSDGKEWEIRLSDDRIKHIALRGRSHLLTAAYIVPEILSFPTAIFKGIREDGEKDWLCYCGIPTKSYRGRDGTEAAPYSFQVFLVFVNEDRVVYNWRWEKCDQQQSNLPMNFEERFLERLL